MSRNSSLEINSNIHNNILLSNDKGEKMPIAFPSGMLLVWNKPNDTSIPKGWTKCDGGEHAQKHLKRSNNLLNNGHPIPDFQGKFLRMYNPRNESKQPITAGSDRKFKGYSNSNMFTHLYKHMVEGDRSYGGQRETTMERNHIPRHQHDISFDKTSGLWKDNRRKNRLTSKNSSDTLIPEMENTFHFKSEPSQDPKPRNNIPPYRILTYIVKL